MRKIIEDIWVEIDGIVSLGLTKSFVEDSGDITFVNFKVKAGDEVKEGDTLISVETAKSVVDVKSPMSGKVVEINEEASENPDVINENPEGVWLVKIEAPEEEVRKLKEG